MGVTFESVTCRQCGWNHSRSQQSPSLFVFVFSLIWGLMFIPFLHGRREFIRQAPWYVQILVVLLLIPVIVPPLIVVIGMIKHNYYQRKPLPAACPKCNNTDLDCEQALGDG